MNKEQAISELECCRDLMLFDGITGRTCFYDDLSEQNQRLYDAIAFAIRYLRKATDTISQEQMYSMLLADTTPKFKGMALQLHSVITDKANEHKMLLVAPFKDATNKPLVAGDYVVNDDGTEMVLSFGPYTAYDDDGIYDGWGWYLQAGRLAEDGKLGLYQITPFTKHTPAYIKKIDHEPNWYAEYVTLRRTLIDKLEQEARSDEDEV